MGRWFLVRHGETDWNAAGRAQGQSQVPLNTAGRAQARALAVRLRPLRFTAAYASDLPRVTDTAAPILHGRDLHLVTLPALREKSFGEWEGMTFGEMEAHYPESYAELFSDDGSFAPPGGESDRQLFQRVAAAVERLRETHGHDRGDLLLVAHGGSLCAAIVHLLALPADSMWRFRLDNGGVSAITLYDDGGAALDLLNDTSHLQSRRMESKA